MQAKADIILDLIDFPFRSNFARKNGHGQREFYQHLLLQLIDQGIKTHRELLKLCSGIFSVAEQALRFRQAETIKTLTKLTAQLPLPRELRITETYYNGMAEYFGGEVASSRPKLETVAEAKETPPHFRARAISCLGQRYFYSDADAQSAKQLFDEAGRIARGFHQWRICDPLTVVQVHRNISIMTSTAGDNQTALARLNDIHRSVESLRFAYPHEYYDYKNSLAVELATVGRLAEAAQASQIALASPFAPYYPQWLETKTEIAAKKQQTASRSVIAVPELPPVETKVLDMAAYLADRDSNHIISSGFTGTEDFEARMAEMRNAKTKEEPAQQKTYKEKRRHMLEALVDAELTEETIDRIIDVIESDTNKDTPQN